MKKRLKVLCICEHGNTRSVALAYLIKTIYGHEAIAIGEKDTSFKTKLMLFDWADKIIVLADCLIPMQYLSHVKNKYIRCDVGPDIWFNPKDQELIHRLLKKLKTLDL